MGVVDPNKMTTTASSVETNTTPHLALVKVQELLLRGCPMYIKLVYRKLLVLRVMAPWGIANAGQGLLNRNYCC